MQIKLALLLRRLMKIDIGYSEHNKKDILQYCSEQTRPAWPPTTEQFSTFERNIPESIFNLFLAELLQLEKHGVSRSEILTRVVESYVAEIVHWISRGEITSQNIFRHFLLGLGTKTLQVYLIKLFDY